MRGVEPLIPVDVELRGDALKTVVERLQALVDKLREIEHLELVARLDVSDLGDGIVEPHCPAVDFGQRLVGPYLHAQSGRDERLPCLRIHIGAGAVFPHVAEIVVAGDNHLIIPLRIGIGVGLQVLVVVVEGYQLIVRLVGRLNELAAGLGEENFLVADGLHLGHDTKKARVHLCVGGEAFVTIKLVVGLRIPEVRASAHGEQSGE